MAKHDKNKKENKTAKELEDAVMESDDPGSQARAVSRVLTTRPKDKDKKAGGGYMQSKGGAAGGVKKKKIASSASSRADGIAKKGKTKGRMV